MSLSFGSSGYHVFVLRGVDDSLSLRFVQFARLCLGDDLELLLLLP